ncbi:tyrosine-type recombinase/integrase [Rhodobacter lacus]|uniref:Tyrosine-type recombinase/integrase n=1 Tax=Rhodobacter lacus TaxID=1641972 RepID=A0ABW5A7U9_9RHOB
MIPITPALQSSLADLPKNAPTCLLTEYGRPCSAAGFGNWMRDRCDEAGLSNCSSHGLRKACARRLAEAGCPPHEIKSITGHKTDAEVRRYTAKADQVLLAQSAFEKLRDTANTPKSANPFERLASTRKISMRHNNLRREVAARREGHFSSNIKGLGLSNPL